MFTMSSQIILFLCVYFGYYIVTYLDALNIPTDFIRVDGDTRINVKLKAELETELNAAGPTVTKEDMDKLKDQISTFTNDDLVIFSGSIPKMKPDNTYLELVEMSDHTGVTYECDLVV